MSYDRNKPIALAVSELEYHEKASNSQLDDKYANSGSGNWTKYGRDLDALGDFYNGPKNGFAWCDQWYDWLLYKCFGKDAAMKLLCQPKYSAGAGCYYSALYYKQHGQFYGPGTVPEPADQIFFTYAAGEVSHTGIVEKVVGNTIYTIEGNTSDGVYRRSYKVGSSAIYGYGRPKWEDGGADAGTDTNVPATLSEGKTVDELAREVIAGMWGVGETRKQKLTAAGYDAAAVQKRVNEIILGTPAQEHPAPAQEEPVQTTAPLVGYAIYLEEISEGATGNFVKAVQTLLILRGYSCGRVFYNGSERADGEFGPMTKDAVMQFQKANGLVADGVVGANTMTALLK